MPQVRVGELNVHYQQSGNGPDVVLVHAFTSNLAVWMMTNIVVELAKSFRVTMYDLRGHGLTTATPSGYDSAHLAEDLHELHAQLQLQPAWLVGHSYGGVIGMHAAALFPEMVRGVVVADSYFPGLAHLEPAMPHAQPWGDLRQTFAQSGLELPATVDFSQLFALIAQLDAEQQTALHAELGPAGTRWLTGMRGLVQTQAGAEAFQVAGLTEDLIRGVHQPVVALYDEYTPFAATRDFLQNTLPDCVVDVVPHAKHLAPVENSRDFVERVHRHLCRLANGSVRA